jgi:Domain of unknown function (DUF4328)
MEALSPEPRDFRPYRSNRFWTRATVGLLGIYALATTFTSVAQAWLRCVVSDAEQLNEPCVRFVMGLQAWTEQSRLPLRIAIGIAFLAWLYRAYSNLPALGSTAVEMSPGHGATPGDAVVGWFIPVANLVLGYRSVRHLWLESQAQPATRPDGSPIERPTPLVGYWWTVYLARSIVSAIVLFGAQPVRSLDDWKLLTEHLVLPQLLDVVAALLCILVVHQITRRQEEQQRDILLRAPVPPVTDRLR